MCTVSTSTMVAVAPCDCVLWYCGQTLHILPLSSGHVVSHQRPLSRVSLAAPVCVAVCLGSGRTCKDEGELGESEKQLAQLWAVVHTCAHSCGHF
jgi:hypothetical protein